MYDIIFIGEKNKQWKSAKQRFPLLKHANTLDDAKRICITKMFWVVWPDIIINNDFNFDYEPDAWSTEYIHVFKNNEYYDGVCLIPKSSEVSVKELQHRFFVNKKEVDIQASRPCAYDIFNIDTYADYLSALETSETDMFWMSTTNIGIDTEFVNNYYIPHHEVQILSQNHAFVHQVDDKELYNGLFLCSKKSELSKKEVEHRFIVNKIEHDIVASGPTKYNVFNKVDTYEEYLSALETSGTEMFYVVPSSVIVSNDFNFDQYFPHDNVFDRKINHMFLNGKFHDGVILCSKHSKISEREWLFRFIANKKEHDIAASIPVLYDIVFISYQEPNADENFENLKTRFPDRVIHRVHGVKGIHQAHIEAAKVCDTPMFYIVDGDAVVVDDFNFDWQVPAWQYNHVHVWRSKNPVNGLVYGYGGIKLFPRLETLNMDTSKPDMTTSISDKFVAMPKVSNITAFNTDPFNAWKSAFRECAKLSSKVIDRQKSKETNERLRTWCIHMIPDTPFGEDALQGAKAGTAYGTRNKGNVEALKNINDFDWLKEKFNGNT